MTDISLASKRLRLMVLVNGLFILTRNLRVFRSTYTRSHRAKEYSVYFYTREQMIRENFFTRESYRRLF